MADFVDVLTPHLVEQDRSRASKKSLKTNRTSQARYSREQWANIRPLFTQLYGVEDKTLSAASHFLKEHHGFDASTKMYKTWIKRWGLSKYQKRTAPHYSVERVKAPTRAVVQALSINTVTPTGTASFRSADGTVAQAAEAGVMEDLTFGDFDEIWWSQANLLDMWWGIEAWQNGSPLFQTGNLTRDYPAEMEAQSYWTRPPEAASHVGEDALRLCECCWSWLRQDNSKQHINGMHLKKDLEDSAMQLYLLYLKALPRDGKLKHIMLSVLMPSALLNVTVRSHSWLLNLSIMPHLPATFAVAMRHIFIDYPCLVQVVEETIFIISHKCAGRKLTTGQNLSLPIPPIVLAYHLLLIATLSRVATIVYESSY